MILEPLSTFMCKLFDPVLTKIQISIAILQPTFSLHQHMWIIVMPNSLNYASNMFIWIWPIENLTPRTCHHSLIASSVLRQPESRCLWRQIEPLAAYPFAWFKPRDHRVSFFSLFPHLDLSHTLSLSPYFSLSLSISHW